MSWRVFWILALLFGVSAVLTASAFFPEALATNEFLEGFVNHELISILVVVVTITFASVSNIELALNRMQRRIVDPAARKRLEETFVGPLRLEVRSSAWLLFWALAIALVVVLVKGEWPHNQFIVSGAHGFAILIVIANGVVLYDIYGTSFALVEGDNG